VCGRTRISGGANSRGQMSAAGSASRLRKPRPYGEIEFREGGAVVTLGPISFLIRPASFSNAETNPYAPRSQRVPQCLALPGAVAFQHQRTPSWVLWGVERAPGEDKRMKSATCGVAKSPTAFLNEYHRRSQEKLMALRMAGARNEGVRESLRRPTVTKPIRINPLAYNIAIAKFAQP